MKTYKAGELREDMLVVPAHMLEAGREELARLRADSAELARVREPISDIEIHNIAFEIAVTDDRGGYYFEPDDLEKFVAEIRPIPEGFALVPVEPTEAMLKAADDTNRAAPMFTPMMQVKAAEYRAMLAAAPKGDSHE